MKKIIGIYPALIGTLFLLMACNSGSNETYDLKMRLAQGDSFLQNIDMTMNMSMAIMGMNQDIKMNMDVGSKFDVLDSTAEGKKLKMTYTAMKMKMDMGALGQAVNTDSIFDKTSEAVGKSLTLFLKDKKIIKVEGIDSLHFQGEDSVSKAMLDKMFTADNLNNTFGMMFNMYPGKPVKIGESWNVENEIELGMMKMKVATTYTLVSVKNGLAELDIKGKINSKGSMKQGTVEIGMDMTGTQKGKLFLNQATGYTNNGKYDMDVTANMDAMGQKIPMTIKANYTLMGSK